MTEVTIEDVLKQLQSTPDGRVQLELATRLEALEAE